MDTEDKTKGRKITVETVTPLTDLHQGRVLYREQMRRGHAETYWL